ncbi:hypothetical protein ACJX0J_016833, partial [Zea mays]
MANVIISLVQLTNVYANISPRVHFCLIAHVYIAHDYIIPILLRMKHCCIMGLEVLDMLWVGFFLLLQAFALPFLQLASKGSSIVAIITTDISVFQSWYCGSL